MVFDPGLTQGSTLSNQELCSLFGCSTQGGMRRSNDTNTLVLILLSINFYILYRISIQKDQSCYMPMRSLNPKETSN